MELTRVTASVIGKSRTLTVVGTGNNWEYDPAVYVNTGAGYTAWSPELGMISERNYAEIGKIMKELLAEGFTIFANGLID